MSGRALFPAAGFVELATAVARGAGASDRVALLDVVIPSPCLLAENKEIFVDVRPGGGSDFVVGSDAAGEHARGSCASLAAPTSTESSESYSRSVASDTVGASFLVRGGGSDASFVSRLGFPADHAPGGGGECDASRSPPAALDAALQLGGARRILSESRDVYIPVAVRAFVAASERARELLAVARLRGDDAVSDHSVRSGTRDYAASTALAGATLRKVGGRRARVTSEVDGATHDPERREGLNALHAIPAYEVSRSAVATRRRLAVEYGAVYGRSARPRPPSSVPPSFVSVAGRLACAVLEAAQHLARSTSARERPGAHARSTLDDAKQGAFRGATRCASEELADARITACAHDPRDAPREREKTNERDAFHGSTLGGTIRVDRLLASSVRTPSSSSKRRVLEEFDARVRHCSEDEAPLCVRFPVYSRDDRSTRSTVALTSVAVTGGLGVLGSLAGAWCVSRAGARALTLVGRVGRASRVAIGRMHSDHIDDVVVRAVRRDVALVEDAAFLDGFRDVDALIHAGGVLLDAAVGNQTRGSVAGCMAPKANGLARLVERSFAAPTRATAAFSSVASLVGSGGQINYCAANGWLDEWAGRASRAGVGGAPVSIQWGAWRDVGGMAARRPAALTRATRHGVGSLSPEVGVRALEAMLLGAAPTIGAACVNTVDWSRILRSARERNAKRRRFSASFTTTTNARARRTSARASRRESTTASVATRKRWRTKSPPRFVPSSVATWNRTSHSWTRAWTRSAPPS